MYRIHTVSYKENIREAIRHYLEKKGHKVTIAQCSSEIDSFLAQNHTDLLILDVGQGFDLSYKAVLGTIKGSYPNLPVIVLTETYKAHLDLAKELFPDGGGTVLCTRVAPLDKLMAEIQKLLQGKE